MLLTIDNGVGVDIDTFERRPSRGFRYTINPNVIYIDCVTKFVAGTAFECVKVDTNAIVDCWRQLSCVDMRKRM